MANDDLLSGDRSNVVYIEQDGQKRWVLDPATLEQTLGGWSRVQPRPQAQVDAMPAGDTWPSVISGVNVPDGYLITSGGSPEVDVMVQARRCWVPDPVTFALNGFDWRNVGQISASQWDAIPRGPALSVTHPVHVETPEADVGSGLAGGHLMQTTADLPEGSRTLYCTTRTHCTNWVVGFTGGVAVTFLDANHQIIGNTDVQSFGVDALGVFWKPHERTDPWTWAAPEGTAAISVIHMWAPRDRWAEDIAELQAALARALEAYWTYQKFRTEYQKYSNFSWPSDDQASGVYTA